MGSIPFDALVEHNPWWTSGIQDDKDYKGLTVVLNGYQVILMLFPSNYFLST